MRRVCTFLLSLLLMLVIISNFSTDAVQIPSDYSETTHELRGVWVATVDQIDISRQLGNTPTAIEKYKNEYLKILDTLQKFKMNAIFFQVRPMNDAFYKSEINPWSRHLIGIEGKDPGWDPLPWLIEEAHKRGIEFHAWLNPYRASGSIDINNDGFNRYLDTLDDKSFAKQNRDLLVVSEEKVKDSPSVYKILLNPGEPKVRKHIFDTIEEIITNYDVDAIHFDDYFYNDVADSQDNKTYQKAGYNPLGLNKKDWRREQVNILVKGIHDLIEEYNITNNDNVQFGISPNAMWAPGDSNCGTQTIEGGHPNTPCWGYYSYHDLYADTRKWVREEWVDYILPQNYFNLGNYHVILSEWWANEVRGTSVKLYMGLGPYNLGKEGYGDKQLAMQLRFNKQFPEIEGIVMFSYKSIAYPSNTDMIAGAKSIKDYWTVNTLLPHTSNLEASGYQVPKLTTKRTNNQIEVSFISDNIAVGYSLYRFKNNEKIVFTDDKLVDRYRNFNYPVKYYDDVINDDEYTYILKAHMPDHSIHSSESKVTLPKYINKNAPEILNFEIIGESNLYAYKDKITIKASFKDLDGDRLNVQLHLSLKDNNYRYELKPDIVDNNFEYEFEFYSIEGTQGDFRLVISDGYHETVIYSNKFDVRNIPIFIKTINKQLYNHSSNIRNILE